MIQNIHIEGSQIAAGGSAVLQTGPSVTGSFRPRELAGHGLQAVAVPLERAERFERRRGIRGYALSGAQIARSVELVCEGFTAADAPVSARPFLLQPVIGLGRSAPGHRNAANPNANFACLRAYDGTGQLLRVPSMAVSRRHFELMLRSGRLYLRTLGQGGRLDGGELSRGEITVLKAGDVFNPTAEGDPQLDFCVLNKSGMDYAILSAGQAEYFTGARVPDDIWGYPRRRCRIMQGSSMTPAFKRPSAGLVAVLFLVLTACSDDQQTARRGPPPGVLVATAGMVQIADTVEYIGRTVAVNDTLLRAQVEGYLLERKFEEGDDIKDGAELFLIDPALYEAQVAAARGSVAEVAAAVNRASQDVARQTKLVKQKAASQQRLEEAEAALLQAQARLISAQAALQKAEIDLAHTIIIAPFKGRIGRAFYSIGSLVTPSSGDLARLVELDPMYVNFSVSEGDVLDAKRRLRRQGRGDIGKVVVKLRLPDGSLFEHEGRIDFIDNVVDSKTGTVILRASFPNPEKLLVPGLYVRAVLGRKASQSKLTIPQSAIQEDQAGKFVMVVNPDKKVEQRRIKTGRADAGNIVVMDGLQAGEEVIVEGIQKVRPGIVVDARMSRSPNPNGQRIGDKPDAKASEQGSDKSPAKEG